MSEGVADPMMGSADGERDAGGISARTSDMGGKDDRDATEPEDRAHVLVVGNQKGGSGKSTTAMHVAASLMAEGARVACLDLDAEQGTLTRYIANRRAYCEARKLRLPMPAFEAVKAAASDSRGAAETEERETVAEVVARLSRSADFLVIDTPGSDNSLSRIGHSYADTLITPLNDSFVDLDVLATIDPESYEVRHPSKYAEMVFRVKMEKARREGGNRTFDWVVMRNRLGQLDSKNQRAMDYALDRLAGRIRFRTARGFSERVIFRELFLKGLTLLDLKDPGSDVKMNMSHLAARQEVRDLMREIGLVNTAE
ncbi:division plane positioning ATPase MipZ [Marivibrio halodurans]|nr:division plane positioning ATPase MipZ [Marivibrio halodurans]